MSERVLLVLNPCAGQRRANKSLAEIIRAILDADCRCETYVTARRGDCTDFLASHASEFDRVICAGGDGTLNETIAGVLKAGSQISIGYIPCGTTNDFASSLGLSSDVEQAARDAVGGVPCPFDVGQFDQRYFTYTASCGAFTKASYSTPQPMKNVLGHLAYILEGIKDLPSIRPIHLNVKTEAREIEDDFIFFAVTNSTSVGGILKLNAERVALNDGLFEVMLVRHPTTAMQLSSIIHGITTMDLPNEMIHFFNASEIGVKSDLPIEWTLDGERADGGREVSMRNLHSAVRIVLPEAVRTK